MSDNNKESDLFNYKKASPTKRFKQNNEISLELPQQDSFENSNFITQNNVIDEKLDELSQGLGNALSSLMIAITSEFEKIQEFGIALQQLEEATDKIYSQRSASYTKKAKKVDTILQAFKD